MSNQSYPNDDNPAADDSYYADDVQAAAMADNNMDPDNISIDDDYPVTSGDMEIGNLDADAELSGGSESSYDEESVPAGDNVVGED